MENRTRKENDTFFTDYFTKEIPISEFEKMADVKLVSVPSIAATTAEFDLQQPGQQKICVNGHWTELTKKTFTTQSDFTADRNSSAITFWVDASSRSECLFLKYGVAAVYSRDKKTLLVAKSIIVAAAEPSKAVFVLLRLATIYGACKDIEAVLYCIQNKELLIKGNNGTRNIHKALKDGNYMPNLLLQGAEIDVFLAEAEFAYNTYMTEQKLFADMKREVNGKWVLLKTTTETPWDPQQRDILPEGVSSCPIRGLFDVDPTDYATIQVLMHQKDLKAVASQDPNKNSEENGGDSSDDDNFFNTKTSRAKQSKSAKKSTTAASKKSTSKTSDTGEKKKNRQDDYEYDDSYDSLGHYQSSEQFQTPMQSSTHGRRYQTNNQSTESTGSGATTGKGRTQSTDSGATTGKGRTQSTDSGATTGKGSTQTTGSGATTGKGSTQSTGSGATTGKGSTQSTGSGATTGKGSTQSTGSGATTDKGSTQSTGRGAKTSEPSTTGASSKKRARSDDEETNASEDELSDDEVQVQAGASRDQAFTQEQVQKMIEAAVRAAVEPFKASKQSNRSKKTDESSDECSESRSSSDSGGEDVRKKKGRSQRRRKHKKDKRHAYKKLKIWQQMQEKHESERVQEKERHSFERVFA